MGIGKHSRRMNCVYGVTNMCHEHWIAKYYFNHFNHSAFVLYVCFQYLTRGLFVDVFSTLYPSRTSFSTTGAAVSSAVFSINDSGRFDRAVR